MSPTSKARHLRRAAVGGIAALLLVHGGLPAAAQEDLTLPPRIDADTDTEGVPVVAAPPVAVRTDESIEEIVVVSEQNPWRLPDLGSSWRDPNADQPDTGRISAELLPLWDPEAQEMPTRDPYALGDAFRRVGFIEVFRVRFGRR